MATVKDLIVESIYVADGQLLNHQVGLLRPSNANLPIEILRERFHEDGYLFVKSLLPRDHVLKARESYFRFLSASDVLKPGTSPVDGIFNLDQPLSNFPGLSSRKSDLEKPKSKQAALFSELTAKAHNEEWYTDDFCKHPNLIEFVARITQWKDVRQFKRSLFRCNLPQSEPIGVHYDQMFLRQGDVTNITAWCAMGDVKINGGGLMYLEQSKVLGEEFETSFTHQAFQSGLSWQEAKSPYNKNMTISGGLSTEPAKFAAQHNCRWLISSFEAGDVVLHDPFVIHASTVNTDPKSTIRLSTDLRFYDASRPYDQRWLQQFFPGDEV
ncbi:hypothetical protein N7510_000512 [Penicillium lagena]|uniref:uncharacterized protein n=1 Tax=Penicillium lagena TaxID=94218 RepID=UPI00253F91F9|nr:uncharacterized protein N7510_000512 [Penicillium lagena]KAJ5624203.1 hypothetical protein N7510_000512 [Penicillium lagena]